MSYSDAHGAALEKDNVSPYSVYHPDVINRVKSSEPGSFNANWLRFGGWENEGRANWCKKQLAVLQKRQRMLQHHLSKLKQYAEAQGWKPSQTDGGPLKYVDENGIPRVTIKQGSSRAPGSANPHVEFKDAVGQRTDTVGNPVTRKTPDNHTSIDFDL